MGDLIELKMQVASFENESQGLVLDLTNNPRGLIGFSLSAGGGGAVRDISIPNALGFHHISLTESLAVRSSGSKIEEVGVTPDWIYSSSSEDYLPGSQRLKEFIG